LKSGYKSTLVLFFFKTVLAILCLLHQFANFQKEEEKPAGKIVFIGQFGEK